jgi:hypothetical protein
VSTPIDSYVREALEAELAEIDSVLKRRPAPSMDRGQLEDRVDAVKRIQRDVTHWRRAREAALRDGDRLEAELHVARATIKRLHADERVVAPGEVDRSRAAARAWKGLSRRLDRALQESQSLVAAWETRSAEDLMEHKQIEATLREQVERAEAAEWSFRGRVAFLEGQAEGLEEAVAHWRESRERAIAGGEMLMQENARLCAELIRLSAVVGEQDAESIHRALAGDRLIDRLIVVLKAEAE